MTNRNTIIKVGLTITLLLMSLNSYSQKYDFGMHLALNLVKPMSVDRSDCLGFYHNYEPLLTYSISGIIRYHFSDKIQFSVEPGYIMKGSKNRVVDRHYIGKFNYFSIPILTEFKIHRKFYFLLGPELVYRLDQIKEHNIIGCAKSERIKIELSVLYGINFRILNHIEISIRNGIGITPFKNYIFEDRQSGDKIKRYNRYHQLAIRYII